VGGLVAPGAVAGGTLDPRTLASGASVGGGKPHAGPDAARGRMRSRGKAVEAVWGKCGHSQHLMNETSPSKEWVGSGLSDAQIMDTAAVGVAQKEDDEERIDEQDIFD